MSHCSLVCYAALMHVGIFTLRLQPLGSSCSAFPSAPPPAIGQVFDQGYQAAACLCNQPTTQQRHSPVRRTRMSAAIAAELPAALLWTPAAAPMPAHMHTHNYQLLDGKACPECSPLCHKLGKVCWFWLFARKTQLTPTVLPASSSRTAGLTKALTHCLTW